MKSCRWKSCLLSLMYCHTSGKYGNTIAAMRESPLGSLVCLNSTCSRRKRHWRTRSSAFFFCSKGYFSWWVGVTAAQRAAENSVLSRQPPISKAPHRKDSGDAAEPQLFTTKWNTKWGMVDLSPGAGTLCKSWARPWVPRGPQECGPWKGSAGPWQMAPVCLRLVPGAEWLCWCTTRKEVHCFSPTSAAGCWLFSP